MSSFAWVPAAAVPFLATVEMRGERVLHAVRVEQPMLQIIRHQDDRAGPSGSCALAAGLALPGGRRTGVIVIVLARNESLGAGIVGQTMDQRRVFLIVHGPGR